MAEEVKNTEAAEVAAEAPVAAAPVIKQRGKSGRFIPSGIAYVLATFNNTKVTFTDLHGNVLCWSTGGKNGFKGSRKSTAYAAQGHRRRCGEEGSAPRHEGSRSPDQGTGRGPRIRGPRHCGRRA